MNNILPTETTISSNHIPPEIYDEISDWLSDFISEKYGFCHFGFEFEIGDIKIKNIQWDTSE